MLTHDIWNIDFVLFCVCGELFNCGFMCVIGIWEIPFESIVLA